MIRRATNHPSVKAQTLILHRNAIAYYAINKKKKKKNKEKKKETRGKKREIHICTHETRRVQWQVTKTGAINQHFRAKCRPKKKKSARACRCCFRSLPLFKHRTRYTLASPSPSLSFCSTRIRPIWFFDSREKKKKLNIENRSALVTTLIPKSH